MSTKKMSMKLMVDRKTRRILFAEAGKDVVDFLFSLLALPLGSITKLLTKENMPGSVGCIYKRIEDLGINYFKSENEEKKNFLLNPSTPVSDLKSTLSFVSDIVSGKYYLCSHKVPCSKRSYYSYTSYFTDVYRAKCTGCYSEMSQEVNFAFAASEGIVKDMVMYTVMDDLTITPMSSVSNIKLLDKLNVEDLSMLQEFTVEIGLKEGLKMVKALLQSKTVLTDVFLGVVEPKPDPGHTPPRRWPKASLI